jgi:class 3 adenylate cyclase
MVDRNADVPTERRIEFRIWINLGDVIVEDGDIFGDGVNVAARLEALAEPGGICISRTMRDQIRDKLTYQFEDRGEKYRHVRVAELHDIEEGLLLPGITDRTSIVDPVMRHGCRPDAAACK